MRNPAKIVGEMMTGLWSNFDVSRSSWFGPSWNALRGMFTESFFKKPMMYKSVVNYDLARALYRNANEDFLLGAGFVRPIIDLEVEYIALPTVSGSSDDAFLNDCISDYWAPQLQEMFRDVVRDSKVLVRYRQPSVLNPLMSEQDRTHGKLEILPPEEVDLTFDPSDPDLVIRAAITHFIEVDTRTLEDVVQGVAPRRETHEVTEVITPSDYRFFDKTEGVELVEWHSTNRWKFVPIWPVYNEYAADLGGGQSDIEPVLPFIQAFHEVLTDCLAAHKYHSIPKAKFKIKDVNQFIKNNWPEAWDETTGRPRQGAKINLTGREIYFFNVDEDGDFLEATSVLGDSKTLLEFLIDCICVAAETPRWAILASNGVVPETDASVTPFQKRITRKRINFHDSLVMIFKMALVANGKSLSGMHLAWPPVRLLDLVSKGQAIQQLVLAFDVAATHQWLADETIVRILSSLFDEVSDVQEEMDAAKKNLVVMPPVAPPSPTQALPPAKKNGTGSKPAAKAAVATTKASGS